MKKKSLRKLHLSKKVIRVLSDAQRVVGAAAGPTERETCASWCLTCGQPTCGACPINC